MVNSVTMVTKAVTVISVAMVTSLTNYVNVINQNNHICRNENYLLFVSDFNHNSNVSTNLVKILNKNFLADHSEVVELVHAGRPKDGVT
jgi:hypothetical protein